MVKVINKNKKIILIIVGIILLISIVLIIKGGNKNNKIIANTHKGIVKEEEYEGIKFSNISMLSENEQTTFTADVTNVSEEDIEKERLHLSLKNKDGKEVVKFLVYFPGGLKKGETKTIKATADGTYSDAIVKEITE